MNNLVFEYYSNSLSQILFEWILFGYYIEMNTIRIRYSEIMGEQIIFIFGIW